jgi:EAL domain-containing protein (putative c-di-GMP-specific phosphodiesterase class I)
VRGAFADPFDLPTRQVTMTISGGIVMAPEDGETFARLIQNAKLALRLVRSEAQSGFRFFTPRLTRLVQGRYRFEAELRDAVGNKEFKAVFQPKIDFQTGRITGAEALARWRRPNGKLISPATFIPVAEQAGLIDAIGMQILEAACEAARTWQLEGFDVTVAVNVSPSQFQNQDLTDTIMAVLRRTGLHPNRLELEITESMAVNDPARVTEFISPLRAMGTKLAIDDFGTGHSNLATLTQLPFDVFKIDRANAKEHLSFGHGPHVCLGQRVANMQLDVAYRQILSRFPKARWTGEQVLAPNNFVHAISSLTVDLGT